MALLAEQGGAKAAKSTQNDKPALVPARPSVFNFSSTVPPPAEFFHNLPPFSSMGPKPPEFWSPPGGETPCFIALADRGVRQNQEVVPHRCSPTLAQNSRPAPALAFPPSPAVGPDDSPIHPPLACPRSPRRPRSPGARSFTHFNWITPPRDFNSEVLTAGTSKADRKCRSVSGRRVADAGRSLLR